MRLLLATHNEHKRREFSRLMPEHEVDALAPDFELPPEDGDTFEQNALSKAQAAAAASGSVSIADDSGIEAAALGGAPGVRSARYAGEHASDEENLSKLLAEAPEGSVLRYVCALAYVDPHSGVERMFIGQCTGTLSAQLRGERGFGYDPGFVPDEQPAAAVTTTATAAAGGAEGSGPLTMAELTDAQKDEISHRGRAVRALLDWLAAGRP